jgi:hypothetical protein
LETRYRKMIDNNLNFRMSRINNTDKVIEEFLKMINKKCFSEADLRIFNRYKVQEIQLSSLMKTKQSYLKCFVRNKQMKMIKLMIM